MLARLLTTKATVVRPFRNSRGFFTSIILRNDTQQQHIADKSKSAVSSAPHGTVLKGLNIYKEGSDPVALKDEEYPEWLWTLLDEPPKDSVSERERQRYERSKAIKEINFIKSKKK